MKTKIVPYNYDTDMEDSMKKENCNIVGIEEMSITYVQNPDTNSSRDEYQHLTVTTNMTCSVGKEESLKHDGFYFDITIPDGEHWSIDDGSELKSIISDFKNRLYKSSKEL